MDLLILTTAKDRSAAAITSASDTTALSGPDDFPQLVLGTTEPLSVRFLTAASTYASWAADPTYTVTANLGYLTADGFENYAAATLSTVIASQGKSGDLALTTTELVDACRLFAGQRPRAAALGLTLQITVTEPSGIRRVYAQLPVQVNFRVPTFTPDDNPDPGSNYLTAAEIAAAYLAKASLGTGVQTALGVAVGSAGAFVVNGGALGTPSSGTLASCTGLPISTGVSGLGSGIAAALAIATGSAGAPVLFNAALGTPSSGTLTNATGLPISTGLTGAGTGVLTALAVNTGSAGAFVINGGALGTPSSGTLTSCTGLPVSTGLSGLGSGIATFLATPSSANLATAVTDETGSGALVFATSPTLVTPDIGAAIGTSLALSGLLTAVGNGGEHKFGPTFTATGWGVTAVGVNDANGGLFAVYHNGTAKGYFTADSTTSMILQGHNAATVKLNTINGSPTQIGNASGTTLNGIAEYADNAAASGAGLGAGRLYRTGDALKIVH